MPNPLVAQRHPLYLKMRPEWDKVRDAKHGESAVKAKRELYLPMLSGWRETREIGKAKYDAYLQRAAWYGATERTIEGLLGALFRKAPDIQGVPERLVPRLQNIDSCGNSLVQFAQWVCDQQLTLARVGVQVDVNNARPDMPYLIGWLAEQGIMWREEVVDGFPVTTHVVIELHYQIPGPEGFGVIDRMQWRVLDLDPPGPEGRYRVRIYEQEETNTVPQDLPAQIVFPTRRGERLDFIPFWFLGARWVRPALDKPTVLDMVDLNYKHYLNSADLEHGRHACALPTPWIATNEGLSVYPMGPTEVWELTQGSTVGMLEFTGQGLAALSLAMEEKEHKMALLGAKLLEEQKRAAETAETARLRQAGEAATLATIANTASTGLTQALRCWQWWSGDDGARDAEGHFQGPTIELNRDFVDAGLTAQEALALMQLWQQGGISQRTFLYLISQGEFLPPGVTPEEEMEEILKQEPALLPAPPPAPGEDDDEEEDADEDTDEEEA